MKKIKLLSFIAALLVSGIIHPLFAEKPVGTKNGSNLRRTTTNGMFRPMDINNIFNYYSNDGDGSFNPFTTDNEGFEFPIGSNEGTCIFEDGLVWTAFKNDTLYCGGSTYDHGLQSGAIVQAGTPTGLPISADPNDPANRTYRVRPDIKPTTNRDSIALETSILQNSEVSYIDRFQNYSANDLLQQYWKDWNEWPAAQGAPYTDVNHNGTYEPGIDIPGFPGADQTLWMVMNDLNPTLTVSLYGSNPMGIEVQRTIWAYNRPDPLGKAIFVGYKIINKSGVELDSMYVAQWVDPDLGFASDDAIGCDTVRNLGFVYNGKASDVNFASLNLPPPSAGFDLLQGAKVPGSGADSAIFDNEYLHGYKNLPMTAFTVSVGGGSSVLNNDPTIASVGSGGAQMWYNLMRGLIAKTGTPYPASITNGGHYCFPGDPVTGTGPTYIGPAAVAPPSDVRMALSSGPFRMAPGDTQQIVVGALVGLGADYLSSIAVLKENADVAQGTYKGLFHIDVAPPAPVVHVAALDKEIALSWGDPVSSARTESFISKGPNSAGYKFEGYNVYQYPGDSPSGGTLVATYDVIDGVTKIFDTTFSLTIGAYIPTRVEDGTDNGISHSITITRDALSGTPLVNDRDYYFAVTAYSYNPSSGLTSHALESAPTIFDVRPQSAPDGVRYSKKPGDTISVTRTGTTDGFVAARVSDPAALTGDTYRIGFTADSISGLTYWNLTDVTSGKTLAARQVQSSQISPPPGGNPGAVIVDGISVLVYGPPPGMNPGWQNTGWKVPSGELDWSNLYGSGDSLEGFNPWGGGGAIGMGQDWGTLFKAGQSTIKPDKLHKVLIKFASIDTNESIVNAGDPNVSMAYRFVCHADSALADHSFLPIVNAAPGYAYQDRRPVPFTAWDEDNNLQQLDVGFLENNAAGGREDGKYDPPSSDLHIDNTSVTREFVFIFGTNYNGAANNAAIPADILNDNSPMMWLITATMLGNHLFADGDELEIIPDYLNTPAVTFSFTTAAPTDKPADQKADIARINVFPNPYFGFNRLETSKYERWVRFTHLPASATIRIFTLAGILVRTIVKNDLTQFTDWDLLNEHQLPAAAGMYIAYIDCGSLGTKTLKFAIIPEQQFLDHY